MDAARIVIGYDLLLAGLVILWVTVLAPHSWPISTRVHRARVLAGIAMVAGVLLCLNGGPL